MTSELKSFTNINYTKGSTDTYPVLLDTTIISRGSFEGASVDSEPFRIGTDHIRMGSSNAKRMRVARVESQGAVLLTLLPSERP